jgi:hypothetical protein
MYVICNKKDRIHELFIGLDMLLELYLDFSKKVVLHKQVVQDSNKTQCQNHKKIPP